MEQIKKSCFVQKSKSETLKADMSKINEYSLKELTEDDVFVFRMSLCGNKVDRKKERFTDDCLSKMAELFKGVTIIKDHNPESDNQVGRIYDTYIENGLLIGCCYMVRNEKNKPTIESIEAGILKECSVSLSVGKAECSICHTDKMKKSCKHRIGESYDGVECVLELSEPYDAYEVSFVAIPAQPCAKTRKSLEIDETEETVETESVETETETVETTTEKDYDSISKSMEMNINILKIKEENSNE